MKYRATGFDWQKRAVELGDQLAEAVRARAHDNDEYVANYKRVVRDFRRTLWGCVIIALCMFALGFIAGRVSCVDAVPDEVRPGQEENGGAA